MKSFFILLMLISVVNASAEEIKGDPKIISQAWYFSTIQLSKAWDLVAGSPKIKMAVVDMDFDLNFVDLEGVFDLNLSKDFSGSNFSNMTSDAGYVQHGTMVSGLIAANTTNPIGSVGIVPNASLVAINIAGIGDAKIDIEEVIRYAVDSGARVVNGSFGYNSIGDEDLVKLKRAIAYAREKNVILVFSAGNYFDNLDIKGPFYPASLTTEFDNVVSVGGSNSLDQVSHASDYGKKNVDLFAPGERIIIGAKTDDYKLSDGTSEASPIAAGVVALMIQANPNLKPAQLKQLLLSSVDKKDSLKSYCVSGGRLNAYKAVLASKFAIPQN